MEKFREALKHSDTVLTVLTGVGETVFLSEEVSKYIEELERLARIGRATETAFEETDIAMFVSYRKDEDIEEKYVDENNSFNFESIEELLGWAGMED